RRGQPDLVYDPQGDHRARVALRTALRGLTTDHPYRVAGRRCLATVDEPNHATSTVIRAKPGSPGSRAAAPQTVSIVIMGSCGRPRGWSHSCRWMRRSRSHKART